MVKLGSQMFSRLCDLFRCPALASPSSKGQLYTMNFVIIFYSKPTIFIRRCSQDPTLIPYSKKTRPLSNWSARVSIVIGCSLLTFSCIQWTSSEHTGIGETSTSFIKMSRKQLISQWHKIVFTVPVYTLLTVMSS